MALTTVPASLSATALTLTTAAQPNITSVGTLTGLTVSGNIAGTLTTAAQTNITSVGTLTALTVDDITIDGSTISDAGDLTLDVAANIILDADGGGVYFKDAGTNIGFLQNSGANDFRLVAGQTDKDIVFMGNDGGSSITALTLDMSEAGNAHFNQHAYFVDNGKAIFGGGSDLQIYHDGTNNRITSNTTFAIDTVDFLVRSSDGSESLISGTQNAAVTLYHNNSAKLATTT